MEARRGCPQETARGDAAAPTWIFRGDGDGKGLRRGGAYDEAAAEKEKMRASLDRGMPPATSLTFTTTSELSSASAITTVISPGSPPSRACFSSVARAAFLKTSRKIL